MQCRHNSFTVLLYVIILLFISKEVSKGFCISLSPNMDQIIWNPQSSKTTAILGDWIIKVGKAVESMLLLGSRAAATPDSLDEDDPIFPFTSSAAMEWPVLAAKPTTLEHNVWRDRRCLLQSYYTLHFCTPQQQGHQPVEELPQSIICVWFGSQGVRTCQHRVIMRTLGSQSSAAQVRVSLSSERKTLHKPSQKAAIYYVETTLWTSVSWTVSQVLWEQYSALVWGRVLLRLLAAHDEAGFLLPV